MLEIKYGANLAIPGGRQFSVSNLVLQSEVDSAINIKLNADHPIRTIKLTDIKKLNLLVIKVTRALTQGSSSKFNYKLDPGNYQELDDPLLMIVGTWVNAITPNDLTLSFNLELDQSSPKYSKDYVTVEIIMGREKAPSS